MPVSVPIHIWQDAVFRINTLYPSLMLVALFFGVLIGYGVTRYKVQIVNKTTNQIVRFRRSGA